MLSVWALLCDWAAELRRWVGSGFTHDFIHIILADTSLSLWHRSSDTCFTLNSRKPKIFMISFLLKMVKMPPGITAIWGTRLHKTDTKNTCVWSVLDFKESLNQYWDTQIVWFTRNESILKNGGLKNKDIVQLLAAWYFGSIDFIQMDIIYDQKPSASLNIFIEQWPNVATITRCC